MLKFLPYFATKTPCNHVIFIIFSQNGTDQLEVNGNKMAYTIRRDQNFPDTSCDNSHYAGTLIRPIKPAHCLSVLYPFYMLNIKGRKQYVPL